MLLGLPSGQGRIGSYIDLFYKKKRFQFYYYLNMRFQMIQNYRKQLQLYKLKFSEQKVFENDSIEQNFPRLFLYANTFETILRILNPSKVVCLTSSKTYQKELLLGFAKDLNTKIECW